MSTVDLNAASMGSALQELLGAQDIVPGDAPSYQLCKTIYSYHPLGAKIADFPIAMAQSQSREIAVPKGPEERLKEAFEAEWKALGADKQIFNVARLARVYGVASVAMLTEGVPSNRPIDYNQLSEAKVAFNVLDPLNTAGSLVLNQDPNAMDFLKTAGIAVNGQAYHRSRTVVLLNEDPMYIDYTVSAFGYVGRSVYQRGLFPLKSFINTMTTDDMIALKAGVLVAMTKSPSSAIDNLMVRMAGQKRDMLKEAQTGNVLMIGQEDKVESLNLQNLDGAYGEARKNILENIASGCGTPAKIINAETFAEGFGEGTEDAKHIAQFIQRLREWMEPLYTFFERICMHRAWSREFYKTIQNDFPEEYGSVGYTKAFYDWRNSFAAKWPSLLEEPDSEKVKVEDVKLKAVVAMLEVLMPAMDPENKATLIQWACDNFNAIKMLFSSPLQLDIEALKEYVPPEQQLIDQAEVAPKPPKPFSQSDSMRALTDAVSRLPDRKRRSLAAV